MTAPAGYVLCATPRTGSTFLCGLLASTGVLGRPESYFREPDEATWAGRFGLPSDGRRVLDYRSFLDSVRIAATTSNGRFGARIMWGSVEKLVEQVGKPPHGSDIAALEATFGPLAFIHLQRRDFVGQAVSWARAEQTGYWHEGDVAIHEPEPNVHLMVDLAHTVRKHDSSWRNWFAINGLKPFELAYEDLVAQPDVAVSEIADSLGVALPPEWQPASLHRKQADHVNTQWSRLLRSALVDAR